MRKIHLIIYLISVLAPQLVCANHDTFNFHFNRIDYSVGLPNNEIRRIHQDKEGYMWFASNNGLIRYDGYDFRLFKNSLKVPDQLYSNHITCLADNDDFLYIGTANGLNAWDKHRRQITKIELGAYNSNIINTILIEKELLWLLTDKGLIKYNTADESFRSYTQKNSNIPSNGIKDGLIDSKGRLWLAFWKMGIAHYEINTDKFITYPPINKENSSITLFEDKEQNIWIGSWGDGLFKMQPGASPEQTTYKAFSVESTDQQLPSNYIYAINQDDKTKNLWIGHRNGLSIMTLGEKHSFTNYQSSSNNSTNDLNDLDAIYKDKQGIMWLGLLGGGVRTINLNTEKLAHNTLNELRESVGSSVITYMLHDKKQTVWLAIKNNGLYLHNEQTKKTLPISHYIKSDILNKNAYISEIAYISRLHEIWVSVRGKSVYRIRLDQQNHPTSCTQLHRKYLNNQQVWRIHEDKKKNVWLLSSRGINVITNENKTLSRLTFIKGSNENFIAQCLAEDREGNLWIGTKNQGVFKFSLDNNKFHITPYTFQAGKINNQNVLSLLVDSQRRIWASTQGGGLNVFHPVAQKFVNVNEEYNLPFDIFYQIKEDYKNNLWLNNESAIIKIDTKNKRTQFYTVTDKLWDNLFSSSCPIVEKDSTHYLFGGNQGYNTLNVNKMNFDSYDEPQLVINDIKVLGESVYSQEYVNCIDTTNHKITLKNNNNNLSFEFASLNFENPQKKRYAYRLKGYEADWNYTDSELRVANYTNLRKGNYTFELRSTDANGSLNNKTKQQAIQILPSPFDTWYAKILYFLVICLTIYATIKTAYTRLKEKKELQITELQKANLEEVTQSKLRFFTNISHELLTPLTILDCSVEEIMRNQHVKAEQTTIMKNNIERLIRLIRQILEFRKMESDNLKLKVMKNNLSDLINKLCEVNFKPLVNKKQIFFSVISRPEEIIGWFDPDKLDKIMYNLLSNAFKYNRAEGFVQVSIKEVSEEQHRYAEITVKDNGIGIAKDKQQQIFTRFYDGEYRKQNEGGTGIGLSLTKNLVELHGGEINVMSELGIGSEFKVKIPIDLQSYELRNVEISNSQEKENYQDYGCELNELSKLSFSNKHILLVDDNADLLITVGSLLSTQHQVIKANNPIEALELIKNEEIDLIISDVMMPEMNGFEFCQEIKTNIETSHIPLLLLTAKNQEEDRTLGYSVGADGYIAKPFKPSLLLTRIDNLFKNKELSFKQFNKQDILKIKEIAYTNIDEQFLNKAIELINDNIDNPEFNFDHFADEMCMSRATLYRKIKSLTGLSVSEFTRHIRLKTACQLLEKGMTNITELSASVGYSDPKYFSKCFKTEFGESPKEYAKTKQKASLTV